MISNTQIIHTTELNPWKNLALEEYLLDRVEKGNCILYLWQNQNTVVIGKNQNAWRECRTEMLEAEGGHLARRLSGGGAVFHDTGNLNFTFLMNKEDYDLGRQVEVILKAVKKVGISAEMTGRNDIAVDGKKFSGNAFCFRKNNAYHHGTILVSADMGKLSRYLQVSQEKIKSKGISSVQSRVTNLIEYQPSLTIEVMAKAFLQAFEEEYSSGDKAKVVNVEDFDQTELNKLYEKYSSWEWRYGEAPKFDINLDTRFQWGGIEIALQLDKGKVSSSKVYSDAMDADFIAMIPEVLDGAVFSSSSLADKICSLRGKSEYEEMLSDISEWILSKQF